MPQLKPRFTKLADGCVRDNILYTDLAGNAFYREWTPTLNKTEKPQQECLKLATECTLLGGGWDLPEDPHELGTITDFNKHSPAIDTEFFADTQSDWYWTKQEHASDSEYAWCVLTGNGYVNCLNRSLKGFARGVRRVPASQ